MLRNAFKRADLIKFFANLAPCLIGMEAWAVRIFGHESLASSVIRSN